MSTFKLPPIKKQHIVLILSLLLNLLNNAGIVTPLTSEAPACPPPSPGLEPENATLPH